MLFALIGLAMLAALFVALEGAERPMRRWAAAALVCAAALAVYLSNGRAIGAGDTLPARYLPWSVLQSGSFALDAFPVLYDDAARRTFPLLDGVPYFLHLVGGRYVSAYPPGPAVVALPVYAPAILAAAPPSPEWAARLEKLAASVITALSVAVLFCALDEVVSRRWAVVDRRGLRVRHQQPEREQPGSLATRPEPAVHLVDAALSRSGAP